MKIHPLIDITDQQIFSRISKKFPPTHPRNGIGTDVMLQPALDKLPAEFIGDFEVLNHPGLERHL